MIGQTTSQKAADDKHRRMMMELYKELVPFPPCPSCGNSLAAERFVRFQVPDKPKWRQVPHPNGRPMAGQTLDISVDQCTECGHVFLERLPEALQERLQPREPEDKKEADES